MGYFVSVCWCCSRTQVRANLSWKNCRFCKAGETAPTNHAVPAESLATPAPWRARLEGPWGSSHDRHHRLSGVQAMENLMGVNLGAALGLGIGIRAQSWWSPERRRTQWCHPWCDFGAGCWNSGVVLVKSWAKENTMVFTFVQLCGWVLESRRSPDRRRTQWCRLTASGLGVRIPVES